MMKRYGKIDLARRYTVRPGAYAMLLRDDMLLLTHERLQSSEIQLPGGGIDAGESPLMALHREVFEETGWHIARPRRLGAYRRFVFMAEYDLWAEKICHIFLAYPARRHGHPSEAHHTALWAPPAVAAQVVADPGSRDFIRRHLG